MGIGVKYMHTAKELEALGCRVYLSEPLSRHTTFGTGGPCDILCECADMESARGAYLYLYRSGIPFEVVGRGSNVLVSDSGFRGVILKFYGDSHIKTFGEDIIYCSGGISAKKAAAFAMEKGLSGFEFAGSIPGSVGGHVAMNAGCFGSEMKDIVEAVGGFIEGEEGELSPGQCGFSHRESVFLKKKGIILWAKFKLEHSDRESCLKKFKEITAKKRHAQPLEFPSCGSVFKRKEGVIPAKLIEEAGLKGLKVGGAEVSTKHSGFIVNRGGATSRDVRELIGRIKREIYDRYAVWLEEEIRYIGQF